MLTIIHTLPEMGRLVRQSMAGVEQPSISIRFPLGSGESVPLPTEIRIPVPPKLAKASAMTSGFWLRNELSDGEKLVAESMADVKRTRESYLARRPAGDCQ